MKLKIIKITLWTYIILCILIAGLNYGYAKKADAQTAAFINWFWLFYENWIKAFFIILCGLLTISLISKPKAATGMRKRNIYGFIAAALLVHIIMPLILNNYELYVFTMPLPWLTSPIQLLSSKSPFYISHVAEWGITGISSILIFYLCYSLVIFIGTILLGRRFQCSTICLFNGFASEVFAPAFPLVGKNKEVKPKTLKVFSLLRWIFFISALIFTMFWIMFLLGIPLEGQAKIISKIESYKYLMGELLAAMFFWMLFIGRGYCYYCPLGTTLSLIGKAADQKITTNNTKCIQCNKCNKACPMTIDVKGCAQNGNEVKNIRCVGCGHCVDACPTKNLAYTTRFLSFIKNRNDRDI